MARSGNSSVKKLALAADRAAELPNGLRLLPAKPPSASAIAMRAWEIWRAEGSPQNRALEHWLRAERELTLGVIAR